MAESETTSLQGSSHADLVARTQAQGKKLGPHRSVKRLPWLEGKASRNAPLPAPTRGTASPRSPTPVIRPPSGKPSARVTPNRVMPKTSTPSYAQATTSSSSPVMNKQSFPRPRRSSVVPGTIAPLRKPKARRSPVLHAPVECREPATLPSHHIESDSSPTASRACASPALPSRIANNLDCREHRSVDNAVENLENIMQEAAELAGETADRRQMEEICEIIEEAKAAIEKATLGPTQRLVPPILGDGGLDSSDSSSNNSPTGVHHKPEDHIKTLPLPPNLNTKNALNDVRPDLPRGSVSYDFAYQPQKAPTPLSNSSRSSSPSGIAGRRSNFSTQSDLLLPPKPIQTVSRDHTDFVLRPMLRSQSRGRPQKRSIDKPAANASGHPLRHYHHRHTRSRSFERHHRHRLRSSDHTESSSSEEDARAKVYGGQLGVREQAKQHTFRLHKQHRRQPIARNWAIGKKRLTAAIACLNTALLGIIVGIYAGEVPRIQYFLADERHIVIIGNAVLYFGLAISTFIVWPLPLLHGRKPYILAALALALPLQFPQAMVVSQKRSPNDARFRTGLLCARTATGLVLGFANVNYITVLLDLFGASLQSKNPHQELVVPSDVRRHGGGMGIWLGIWSWCWIASLAVGFQVGAAIIESLSPDWGFYIVVIILAAALVLNIITPETRRAPYRKSVTELYDRDENYITRRVSRGECKLHISVEGPSYWFEEVWAGMKLVFMMMCQPGFLVLSSYLGWIYAQIVLVIILLGALLSKDYKWQPRYVGAGVMSIAIGALLAVPLTKAGIFSRERKSAFRTDSMTFQKQVTWSSHMVRRIIFTVTLPLMGLAYTVSAAGIPKPHMVPIVFAGTLGFLSILGIAECHGLIMETFDTCDLQPGVNTRHRLESLAVEDRRRRTNYSSFPRVTAGIFASQTIAFMLAGVATLVGGSMTRRLGAQTSTGVTAGILLGLTVLLIAVLWRFKGVQVIPNHSFGTRRDTAAWAEFGDVEKMGRGSEWKAVVIGNPSGKMRKMSVLELGSLSRWTEIRKLNFLLKGPQLGEGTKKRRDYNDS